MPVNHGNLVKAVRAALRGPEARDLRIAEYRFNVKPAKITRSGGTISVVGGKDNSYISRRRRARPNDRIFYKFGKDAAGIHGPEIEIERGGFTVLVRRPIQRIRDILVGIPIPPFPFPSAAGAPAAIPAIPEDAPAPDETIGLLDGSWEAEAEFLITNIALRAR